MDNKNNTIENFEEISIELIFDIFKNYSDKKKAKEIKAALCAQLYPDSLLARPEVDEAVDRVLREDKKLGDESWLTYSKGYYSKRKKKSAPAEVPMQISEYTGRGGECAVMSELLFHNYNVNRMMIDEGVDLVAVKDNIYYYIQVKTVTMKDGKINAQINIENFDKFIGNQMRYVVVARCKDKDGQKNIFFTFTQQEISKGIYDRCVKRGERTVSIKIKFHERTGEPILYDEKETSAKWNMNRFEL
ncbi:MAG: hypothetical protein HDS72_04610 [Bacteroidales bacterium]|nr:hypothetical protein [Bacteroidales bacterium]